MRILDDIQRMCFCLIDPRGIDEALIPHLIENEVPALEGPIRRSIGIVIGRSPDESHQNGDVMQLQLFDRATKIVLTGETKAMNSAGAILPEIDFIEIGFENLFFGVSGIKDHRHDDLVDLSPPGTFRGQVEILDQLLGQGTASLHDPTGPKINENGAQHAPEGDAMVHIKIVVFTGKKGFEQRFRGLIQANQDAILSTRRIETSNLRWLQAEKIDGLP